MQAATDGSSPPMLFALVNDVRSSFLLMKNGPLGPIEKKQTLVSRTSVWRLETDATLVKAALGDEEYRSQRWGV